MRTPTTPLSSAQVLARMGLLLAAWGLAWVVTAQTMLTSPGARFLWWMSMMGLFWFALAAALFRPEDRRAWFGEYRGRIVGVVLLAVAWVGLDAAAVRLELKAPAAAPTWTSMLGVPSHAEVLAVARRTAERIDALLRKGGRSLEPQGDEPEPELLLDEPGLASCSAAAAQGISVSGDRAGLPQLRLVFGTATSAAFSPESAELKPALDEPVAEHRGVNVHAKQCVDGRDRKRLERLCRYITRPPVAQDRLERLADGRVELRPNHPWRDGTHALLLEPDDLLVRLVASVPPPRFHLLRYVGVLSSHSSLRKDVVPTAPPDRAAHAPPPAPGDQLELAGCASRKGCSPSGVAGAGKTCRSCRSIGRSRVLDSTREHLAVVRRVLTARDVTSVTLFSVAHSHFTTS